MRGRGCGVGGASTGKGRRPISAAALWVRVRSPVWPRTRGCTNTNTPRCIPLSIPIMGWCPTPARCGTGSLRPPLSLGSSASLELLLIISCFLLCTLIDAVYLQHLTRQHLTLSLDDYVLELKFSFMYLAMYHGAHVFAMLLDPDPESLTWKIPCMQRRRD